MKSRTAILIGLALLLAHPFALQAQIPRTISYQGILTDPSGNVKPDGPYSFTFRLYDVSVGGTALWMETETNTVKDGLFSTTLGDQTAFPAALTFDKPYWLGIEVESEELLPRISLTASPYSFSALRADTAKSIVANANINIKSIYASITNSTGIPGKFQIYNTSNSGHVLYAETIGRGVVAGFYINNSSNGYPALHVETDGTGEAAEFFIDNGNNSKPAIYVSTKGTGYAGYFAGSVYTTGTYQGSDIRWKRNIAPLEGALNKVLSLRGVCFDWNRDDYPDKGFREGIQIGLIAQEVEEVLPELVRTDQDGYKAVDYPKVTAVLVEAIKEQQKEIEALKAAVAVLQGQSDVALQE